MKEIRFDGAFSPVPDIVHQRLEEALKEKEEMNARKMKRPLALVLAVVLICLAGLAYAATQTGILDYLVGGQKNASDALMGIVQPAQNTMEADGIKIDLTGAVYDGERLSISFDMTNQNPSALAQVTLDQVTLNGEDVSIDFSSANEQWLPSVFNVDVADVSRNPVHGGMLSTQVNGQYTGIIQGEATFVITRPTNGKPIVLDPMMWYDYDRAIEDEETRTDYTARRELVRSSGVEIGSIFDLGDFLDVGYWLDGGYTLLDINGQLLLTQAAYQAYHDEDFGSIKGGHQIARYDGQMTETARITFPFTIDADYALSKRVSLAPKDIELSDCTVHFDQALLTPLSTIISFTLTPKGEPTLSAVSALQERYLIASEILDENGVPVEFLDMESYADESNEEDGKGGYTLRFNYAYGGIKNTPKELHFTLADSPFDTGDDSPAAKREFLEKVYLTLP